jgi:hypothetical protein
VKVVTDERVVGLVAKESLFERRGGPRKQNFEAVGSTRVWVADRAAVEDFFD